MKIDISQEAQRSISEAIRSAEAQSSAEIVTVVTPSSDDYLVIPVLWAALGALLFPALPILFAMPISQEELYGLQLILFLVLLAVGRIDPLLYRLIPPSVKRARARAAARQHFLSLQVHGTRRRASVMLFVSIAERYVEILTDTEVAQRIPDTAWEAVVGTFVTHVKAGKVEVGFVEAVRQSGELLKGTFPFDPEETDELTNHLIIIER